MRYLKKQHLKNMKLQKARLHQFMLLTQALKMKANNDYIAYLLWMNRFFWNRYVFNKKLFARKRKPNKKYKRKMNYRRHSLCRKTISLSRMVLSKNTFSFFHHLEKVNSSNENAANEKHFLRVMKSKSGC